MHSQDLRDLVQKYYINYTNLESEMLPKIITNEL